MQNIDKKVIEAWFVTIPPGMACMRDDRTKETWSVAIDAFKLGKYPVTQDIYQAVTGENPSAFAGRQLPVETVSWIDAANFCNALSESLGKDKCYTINLETENVTFNSTANGFRLPTEAEWQYACQAGTKEIRYGVLSEIAWYKENSAHSTREVGQKEPNEWGLYDMLGNVWEWCSDIYDKSVYGTYRVFRGGGWCDQERSVMATTRRRSHPLSFKIDDLGFRIAINPEK
ncbi:Formylglycine-generating enzyme, required for sulfatase activity, contains SUMF1/FGE domain [Sinomicrobium oceani]|uniref:Formylglycine-generating enzyme, required for sulfatase activity, contains SUMF1/FGE domain n=1 Tax=Sinomicrobium oceani TaxID=1150368 RepID=A0A1K1RPH3_9FLAO|nr:SUMF1/EgtB/PvdO family nonheme iron enzyme [Sinomicrobium oceani]SFW74064.1 Formylglycine-generating enzyme, required for sulfatase activity, contains SUMF1/FGE domain [Sinomicrobium oceani]